MSLFEKHETVIHTLEPVFNGSSRVLVLGTMPSPASRSAGFYYSHPQNRFWQVLSAVFNEQQPYSVDQKRAFALKYGIALWDVLASCEMKGAEDSSIRKPVANDLSPILTGANIKSIYTTGEKAALLYRKLCRPVTGVDCVSLPSTSPANRGRYPLNTLIELYTVLRDH
jgi:double-stranded uracil-DNA glycosylase